jgi:glycosyltransferase
MPNWPLVTIITTALNCADTLEATILSVLGQGYPNIEYIIVVSKSHDSTLDIVDKYKDKINKVIFDPAEGIYPALNSGLRAAHGNVVGILNSDDLYANKDVVRIVAEKFERENLDAVWGDLLYVGRKNTNSITRYWRSTQPKILDFRRGWMAPHPALFVKRSIFEKFGFYETSFKFASDYEMSLRLFYKNKIKGSYIPRVFIKMRQGGRGDRNLIARSVEDYKIAKIYGLGFLSIFLKKVLKISQFIVRPRGGI